MTVKVDLSKAFDRVNGLFLRLIVIHLGFSLQFVMWIMSFISLVPFIVLMNRAASPFFKPKR